jgi:UrcA family protein
MLVQKSCVIVAIALALSSAAAARAETRGLVRQQVVRIDDIDLASAADARRLTARLEKAAKDVCSPTDAVLVDEVECRRQALIRAVNELARRQAAADPTTQIREMTSNSSLPREGANTAP